MTIVIGLFVRKFENCQSQNNYYQQPLFKYILNHNPMKKYLLLFLCIIGLSVSYAQPALKPSIESGPLPNDEDPICHIPFYLNGSAASGYHKGDTVPDFTVYNLNGDSLNLYTALSTGKPALLISGSWTCPITRGKIASINNIVGTYGSQINVYIIYIVEVHPAIDSSPYFAAVNTNPVNIAAGILYRQPTTYGERKEMVQHFLDSMNVLAPMFIDGPCNNWWLHFGPAQNNATLIKPDGTVFAKHAWYDRPPDNMMCDIDSLLGNPVSCQPSGLLTYNFLSTDTVRGNSGDTLSFNGTLVNNSAHNVLVSITRRSNTLPAGWTSAYCLSTCNTSPTDTIYYNLTPGTTRLWQFRYYSVGGKSDTAYVKLRFQNEGDYNNRFNQNLYGITKYTPPPSSFAISGNAGFCRSSLSNIYSITPVENGVTYYWTLPAGATIVTGQGTSTVNVSYSSTALGGNIKVTATNIGGSNSALKSIVLRTTTPAAPGAIIGSNVACSGDVKTYSIRKLATADYYIWIPPIGTTINGSSSPLSTTDTSVSVNYNGSFAGDTLRVKAVNCFGTGAERKLRINITLSGIPKSISGIIYGLCNQSNLTYSISAVANALSYTWRTNIPGATINGSAGHVTTSSLSVSINFGSFVSGQVYVRSNNNCGNSGERSLTLTAKPQTPTSITGLQNICTGQSAVEYSTAIIHNATTYNWLVPAGSSIISGQSTNFVSIQYGALPLIGNIRVRTQNSCGTSAYYSKGITISNCTRNGSDLIDTKLHLNPNPFNLSSILILPSSVELSESEIRIYNVLGVQQRKINNLSDYKVELQRENLPAGIYILRLYSQREIIGSVKMFIR